MKYFTASILLSCMFGIHSLAHAVPQYAHVKCLSIDFENHSNVYDNFLKIRKLTWLSSRVEIEGVAIKHKTFEDNQSSCSKRYASGNDLRTRRWNRVRVFPKPSLLHFSCNLSSLIEIFDSPEDWLEEIKSSLIKSTYIHQQPYPENGYVASEECIEFSPELTE